MDIQKEKRSKNQILSSSLFLVFLFIGVGSISTTVTRIIGVQGFAFLDTSIKNTRHRVVGGTALYTRKKKSSYDLGIGKNSPIGSENSKKPDEIDDNETTTSERIAKSKGFSDTNKILSDKSKNNSKETLDIDKSVSSVVDVAMNWNVPQMIPRTSSASPNENSKRNISPSNDGKSNDNSKKEGVKLKGLYNFGIGKNENLPLVEEKRRKDNEFLTKALWDIEHYDKKPANYNNNKKAESGTGQEETEKEEKGYPDFELTYEDLDFSEKDKIYNASKGLDMIWNLMRKEAEIEAKKEPLLVSFLFSTILNHDSLESALSFHLANRLSSPTMIGTQIQALIMDAFLDDEELRKAIRDDIIAVRDRDPACTCLPDVLLYFKGFHALQTHRVANYLWENNRHVLAHFFQSQVSQMFQIDIHPNATLGSGLMLDHGTGIVIGETAIVGDNCSILHHVTLGGSGKKGVDRHPKIGAGVLIGAGASILGNVQIGDGCQIGAGTLVISDLPKNSVAVGVPAKVIGSFVDDSESPSIGMNQTLVGAAEDSSGEALRFGGDGI